MEESFEYSDNNDYSSLEANTDIYEEYQGCVKCGSFDVTITNETDVCHDCGYVYQ